MVIHDIRFKGKCREDWDEVKTYLKEYSENTKEKHEEDAKFGWYRYDVRFALPVYDEKSREVLRYNVFFARMLVRHDKDGNKYLYDLLAVKKETSSPPELKIEFEVEDNQLL